MKLDSYADTGVLVSAALVNGLTPGFSQGKPITVMEPMTAIRKALAIDRPSLAKIRGREGPGFVALAERLREVFAVLEDGNIDHAAALLNQLLARHPATPHLAKEDGIWRMHHHPEKAEVLPMWTSICAEALARMIGDQRAERLGICSAINCDRVFVDTSKNGSRRFCTVACQNRTKTAAFRQRQAGR